MTIGLVRPTFPCERRVALLPQHIVGTQGANLVIERGFGSSMDIPDQAYERRGCRIATRDRVFAECDTLFCLKLIQREDYHRLRTGQMLIGWTHPHGSGATFMQEQALPKRLKIVDLDNIYPRIYFDGCCADISFIPKNFIWRNSFYAGCVATQHALITYGLMPDSRTRVAVLAPGNVSQGAFATLAKYSCDLRLFYRATLNEFYADLSHLDVIVNGIEVDRDDAHVLSREQLQQVRRNALIIDAAADAGRAIEGTHYTTIDNPMYYENGLFFYVVNNAPSIIFRTVSEYLSEVMWKHVFSRGAGDFQALCERRRS